MMSHKEWLDNEYQQWIVALHNSNVRNFKQHPMVRRMLGDFQWPLEFRPLLSHEEQHLIKKIDSIGYSTPLSEITGPCWRMIYYAVKIAKYKPISVVEIGGGVGQFYAILRALGYSGSYWIYDLPEVQQFQRMYLYTVEHDTGMKMPLEFIGDPDLCVSFYALGEFDEELRDHYVKTVIKRSRHGFVLWNPHSGASEKIPFPCNAKPEFPLQAEGNKELEW